VRLVGYLNRNLFIVSGISGLNSQASEKEMAEQVRASGLIFSWGGWRGRRIRRNVSQFGLRTWL